MTAPTAIVATPTQRLTQGRRPHMTLLGERTFILPYGKLQHVPLHECGARVFHIRGNDLALIQIVLDDWLLLCRPSVRQLARPGFVFSEDGIDRHRKELCPVPPRSEERRVGKAW